MDKWLVVNSKNEVAVVEGKTLIEVADKATKLFGEFPTTISAPNCALGGNFTDFNQI